MPKRFTEISPELINDNVFKLMGSDWTLLSAGDVEDFNMMTAAWGGMGFMWKMPVCYILVRPQRFTYEFTEKYDYFTLNFFTEKERDILNFCGSNSGRDVDKAVECKLTAMDYQSETIYFEEARLALICRKIYFDDVNPENFLDESLNHIYRKKDYHRIYFGKIEKCLIKS